MNIKDKKIKKLFDDLKELKTKLIREINNKEDIEIKIIFLEDLFLIDNKSKKSKNLSFYKLCLFIIDNIRKNFIYKNYIITNLFKQTTTRDSYNVIRDFFENNIILLPGELEFGYKALYNKSYAGLERATELCYSFNLSISGIYPINYDNLYFLFYYS